ncbi:MAG: hypothetical protein K6G69_08360 [Lachnospiraceae bacterium]|nr:hypothetical protein [Lachnospiraceae bacterium]
MISTIILGIIILVIAVLMIVALIRFRKMVNDTKAVADAMTDEEKEAFIPKPDDGSDEDEIKDDVKQ